MADDRNPPEGPTEAPQRGDPEALRAPFADVPSPAEASKPSDAPEEGAAVADFFALGEVFHRVVATAHEELSRPPRLLFWSAVAAGLVLGMSLVARAVVTAHVPDHNPLLGNLLYPIGFVILILGRYQLFTENTLTPVTLVLTRLASFRDLFELWGVVLAGNLLGAFVFAAVLGPFQIFSPEASELAIGFAEHVVSAPWMAAFGKAILAGWLLAIIVWLVHAARETLARVVLIWLLIYLQVTADLFHSIVGALEVHYAMLQGAVSVGEYLWAFQVPVTLGNIVGGVVFVGVLNYIQLGEGEEPGGQTDHRLSTREWIFGKLDANRK